MKKSISVGAVYLGDRHCQFTVWSPLRSQVTLRLTASGGNQTARSLPMKALDQGYWQVIAEEVLPGDRYRYELDRNSAFPDPASESQPDGVHGDSQVWDHRSFAWNHKDWKGIPLRDYVFYELHVGTFTSEGTFAAIIPRLPRLKELGITAIELLPVCPFPGDRNWGYDGVYPYAVHAAYGGPDGLKQLVDACHGLGMAVVLDVVYNHLGPEGNYLGQFGPYFTDTYRTPWGDALNYDDAYSDGVRQYMVQNVQHWFEHYQVDGLRLDAVHGIYDFGATHILAEMAAVVRAIAQSTGRAIYLFPESDLNNVRIIQPPEKGGYGLDAQWTDDFHHALHTLLTGEQHGYYQDFGTCQHLAKSLQEGYVYSGQYSPFRKRSHGNDSRAEPASRFIVCAQNHDQIGNRAAGERLTQLVSFEPLKLAAATVLLSPFLPLLFMGEEYGESAPFLYFISHTDPDLVEAVCKGRQAEFPDAGWLESVANPQDPQVFEQCKLDWNRQFSDKGQALWQFYQTLLNLRKVHPVFSQRDKHHLRTWVSEEQRLLVVYRTFQEHHGVYGLNFSDRPQSFSFDLHGVVLQKILDASEPQWGGSGSDLPPQVQPDTSITLPPYSVVVYDTASLSSNPEISPS